MVASQNLNQPKIILCDDEQLECDALRRIFAQSPIPVSIVGVVNNGPDAIQIVTEKAPDIVFMDIRMPGMTGLEAARQILEKRPETLVIILSAYSDFAYAQDALRIGVMDYVLKPAEPQALYRSLSRAIDRISEKETIRFHQKLLESRLAEILPTFPAVDNEPNDPIQQAIEYIRSNYHSEISLEQAASAVSLSPAYLSRIFSRRTGSKFHKYLIWVRMEAAKYLLKETSLPVKEIAGSVGYTDTNHFSVRFKKEIGQSPIQYRKLKGGT